MKSINVLISHCCLYKGAGWGRIFPLATGLAKNGNKVTIITTSQSFSLFIKKIKVDNVSIIIFPEIIPSRVSRMGFGFLSLFLKMCHVLFNRYDIVHSDNGHRPLSGIPCRLSKRLYDCVYVAEWYDWYGKGGQYDSKKKLFKLLLGRYELKYEIKDKVEADGIVVLSEVLRKRAAKFKFENRIIKIHGGADVKNIPFVYNNTQLKIKYNINEESLTLGYINSDSYRLAEFLPLINVIIKNNLQSKFKIMLFGESDSIKKLLPPEISEFMIFYGWIDFTKDYEKLQCVDVFFLFKEEILGNTAGWPNCIGDFLSCGRPVLLNPVGEVVDFADKYPFSFIKTNKEEEDILKKLLYIAENMQNIKDLGPSIRNIAEDVMSWERKSKDLLGFYHYLLENKFQEINKPVIVK